MTHLDELVDLSVDSMSLLFYLNMEKIDGQCDPFYPDQAGLVSPEISDWPSNEVFQSISGLDEVSVRIIL